MSADSSDQSIPNIPHSLFHVLTGLIADFRQDGVGIEQISADRLRTAVWDCIPTIELVSKLAHTEYHLTDQLMSDARVQYLIIANVMDHGLNAALYLDQFDRVQKLAQKLCCDYHSLAYAVLSGSDLILQYVLSLLVPLIKQNPEYITEKQMSSLLILALQNNLEGQYCLLRDRGIPLHLGVYRAAVASDLSAVCDEIAEALGMTREILGIGLQEGRHLEWVLEQAGLDGLPLVDPGIGHLLLRHARLDLVDQLPDLPAITISESYHCALLSGNLSTVMMVEDRLGDIHSDFLPDLPREASGKKSALLDDIIWKHQGQIRFSHSVNYAIQSGSIPVLYHLLQLGYQITPSNIVTAVRQGSPEMLQTILQEWRGKVPYHLISLFAPKSYFSDKETKLMLLGPRLELTMTKKTAMAHKNISAFLELMQTEDRDFVPDWRCVDYLTNAGELFSTKSIGKDSLTIARTRVLLSIGELELLIKEVQKAPDHHRKLVTESIIWYGSLRQVAHLLSMVLPIEGNLASALVRQLIRSGSPKVELLANYQLLTDVDITSVACTGSTRMIGWVGTIAEQRGFYGLLSRERDTVRHIVAGLPNILSSLPRQLAIMIAKAVAELRDEQSARQLMIPDSIAEELMEWGWPRGLFLG